MRLLLWILTSPRHHLLLSVYLHRIRDILVLTNVLHSLKVVATILTRIWHESSGLNDLGLLHHLALRKIVSLLLLILNTLMVARLARRRHRRQSTPLIMTELIIILLEYSLNVGS